MNTPIIPKTQRAVQLVRCRHVDIAVGKIDRGTGKAAISLKLLPLVRREDFEGAGVGHGVTTALPMTSRLSSAFRASPA